MRIKICGITTLADAQYCEQLGAHAVGFIFYSASKRFVSPDMVARISRRLGPFIQRVGVFVNAPVDEVNQTADMCGLNMVQLHGDESPEYTKNIAVPVIKGFRVRENFNYHVINEFNHCFLLLDAWSDTEMGGTGQAFDWQKIPANIRSRIILAGGVSEHNIEQINRDIHPAAVDLSSSVESSPGIKDHRKLERFFAKAHDPELLVNK